MTQTDVARAAEVSASTVSRVLAGVDAGIPHGTRDRVLRIAQEMGYRRNAIAVGLKRNATDTIGFVSDVIASTPHAGAMVQGSQDAAWERGKVLLLMNSGGDPEVEERAILTMLDRRVDGIIYATMYHQYRDVPELLDLVPTVLLDIRAPRGNHPSVTPDEFAGARQATSHLVGLGHQRIGFVTSSADIPAAHERIAGYRGALMDAGLEFDQTLVAADIDEFDGGVRAGGAIIDRCPDVTAMFCFNDRMAAGAIRAARVARRRVPDDLSVVGIDNQELVALMTDPPLSTFQLPHYKMGRWAVETLLDAPTVARRVEHRIPLEFVQRESTASLS